MSAPPAESRELERVAEMQAALRRVATLVAAGAPPHDVLDAVAVEAGQLLGADLTLLQRADEGGGATVLAWRPDGVAQDLATSTQPTIDPESLTAAVLRTGLPARIDYAEASGPWAAEVRKLGFRSAVGAPVTVEGRLWGVMIVTTTDARAWSPDAEDRLAEFTELVATAIANSEAHQNLARIGEEQAALRRVATRVAEGAEPNDVFAAIADEVAATFDVPIAVMVRYDGDGMATVLATVGSGFSPVGGRFLVEPPTITEAVFRARKSVRFDDWADNPDPAAALARENGVRWAVGVPIMVDGALWGVIAVAAPETVSSAPQVEQRLTEFTELLGMAIANSEAHQRVAQLAEEQAALRRVATLVAEGATPHQVFDAVMREVARMFDVPFTVLMRYDADGMGTVLATWDGYLGPIGRRWPLDGDSSAIARVRQTGRAERVDYSAPTHGSIADTARATGARSAIAVPVEVDGALWGVMAAGSRDPEPLPHKLELRLAKFTELLATAIANAQNRAELEASRARIVATADATRRRIERDLHDGAQQQLLSLALEVRAAQASVPEELRQHRADLAHVAQELTEVLDGLREIALGLHPAILAEGGLGPALKTLARRSPIPVELESGVDGRLPEHVEVAAYYVVAEALTNAAKHAHATVVRVGVHITESMLHVLVSDDGVGGADPARGSGLFGLKDRAEAMGGTVSVESTGDGGTTLSAVLPLGSP